MPETDPVIVQINVNGLRSFIRKLQQLPNFPTFKTPSEVLKFYMENHLRADIVCIQETKLRQDATFFDVDGWDIFRQDAMQKGYSGVMTLAKKGLTTARIRVDDPVLIREGRAVFTVHGKFVLGNIYAPNAVSSTLETKKDRLPFKLEFFDRLKMYMQRIIRSGWNGRFMLAGDWNIALTDNDVGDPEYCESLNLSCCLPEEREKIQELISYFRLTDLYRVDHPSSLRVTGFHSRISNLAFGLDYCLASREIVSHFISSSLLNFTFPITDHFGVRYSFSKEVFGNKVEDSTGSTASTSKVSHTGHSSSSTNMVQTAQTNDAATQTDVNDMANQPHLLPRHIDLKNPMDEIDFDAPLPDHLQKIESTIESTFRFGSRITGEKKKRFVRLLTHFHDVMAFTKAGQIDNTWMEAHQIKLKTNEPIAAPLLRTSQREREIIETEILNLLRLNIIRPSVSPYAARIKIAWKKDGSPRFCINYRPLNEQTEKMVYPLPHVDDILDSLSSTVWMTCLDFASGKLTFLHYQLGWFSIKERVSYSPAKTLTRTLHLAVMNKSTISMAQLRTA